MDRNVSYAANMFDTMWRRVKYRFSSFPQLDYHITEDGIIYVTTFSNAPRKLLGRVMDIYLYSDGMLADHLHATLYEEEIKKEKEQMALDQQEQMIKRATEDGDFWGQFACATLNVNIPQGLLWKASSKLAKAMGYVDTDSNDAFKFALINKIEAYQQANAPKAIAESTVSAVKEAFQVE